MARAELIVDDDAAFRDLAARVVTSWGHVVVGHAGSVAEALASAAELMPDTALVDIGLPDGDGFALARQLAAMPGSVRVILISSDSDAANVPAGSASRRVRVRPRESASPLLELSRRRWRALRRS
jgi:CheY-like chemotaxis protein